MFNQDGEIINLGLNKTKREKGDNAIVVEVSIKMKRAAFYTRYEWTQKTGEELDLDSTKFRMDKAFPVTEMIAGASYDVLHLYPVIIAIGGQLSFGHVISDLYPVYGKGPLGGAIYLRIYLSTMMSHSMKIRGGM